MNETLNQIRNRIDELMSQKERASLPSMETAPQARLPLPGSWRNAMTAM